MERINIGNGSMAEKYVDENGKVYIRMKYNDRYRTEVIMQESEFERVYGEFD